MREAIITLGVGGFLVSQIMNITPQFVKSPAFIKFERVTGSSAYKYITLLGMYCQQSRNPDVTIEEPLDLELLIGADDNGEKILSDLLKFKLIEQLGEVTYSCTFFIDQNKQLPSNWNNGAMSAKRTRARKEKEEKEKRVLDDVDQHFVEFYQSDEWKEKQAEITEYYEDNIQWRESNEG